tara:strand:- start:26081 stop:26503 length:423 start_codon:yes stop_codon:yes gene_type:complete
MANRKKRTQKLDDAFFEALSAHGFVTKACKTSGYKRSQVYVWKDEDEAFGERWDDAIAEHVEKLEAEADRRAVKGVDRGVFFKGKRIAKVTDFSDTLLIFRLKALSPEKYRERFESHLTGAVQVTKIERVIVGSGSETKD